MWNFDSCNRALNLEVSKTCLNYSNHNIMILMRIKLTHCAFQLKKAEDCHIVNNEIP
jgi:hypothetical protein